MVMSVGAIGNENHYIDYEHMKIIQELYRLGIKPTGIKELDKAKLKAEKEKIINQIKQKAENIEQTDKIENKETIEKARLEEERLGAKTVSELNKILHGLK